MADIELDMNDKNIRELLTYLKNEMPIQQSDGSIKWFKKDEIDKILVEKLKEGDYKIVEELIKIAETGGNQDDNNITKYTSKSIRVSTPIYANLNQKALLLGKAPISHIVGMLAAEHMKVVLKEISESINMNVDKVQVNKIEQLIEKWEETLHQVENLGARVGFIKKSKEDEKRRLKEMMVKAQDDRERLRIKYSAEGMDKINTSMIDVDDDYEYVSDDGTDRLSYWDEGAYFYVNTPLKPTEHKELYLWFVDKILHKDFPGISEQALQSFKEKIVLPELSSDKQNDYIPMDVHLFPGYLEISAWKQCELYSLYNHYKKYSTNIVDYGDFSKTVESMMLDFQPDDMDKLFTGAMRRLEQLRGPVAQSNLDEHALHDYYLSMKLELRDFHTSISENMDSILFDDFIRGEMTPLDTRLVNVLENVIFSSLLAGISNDGIDVPSPEKIKSEYIKEHVYQIGIDETFSEYQEKYKQIWEWESGQWPKKDNAISYLVAARFLEFIIEKSYLRKDLKRAKLYNRYAMDIKTIFQLSEYIAKTLRAKKSVVITIAMPKYLQSLWEIGKGKKPVNEYVKKLILEYGDCLQPVKVEEKQST